jgi:AcrR family transcriptional regulator
MTPASQTAPGQPAKIAPLQARALKTRAAVLDGVERVAATEGVDAVTTTRIAAVSGVAVGTIYRYFVDRNALLLAAYDATVLRIVIHCAAEMDAFPAALPIEEAARRMLALYLETAAAEPSHAALLRAMRAIRSIESDQTGNIESTLVDQLFAPFWRRFAAGAAPDPDRLRFLSILLGTLVDLWLMTADAGQRERLRADTEAHMLLALERALNV